MRGPWSALLPTPLEFYLAPTMIGGLPYFSLTDSVNDYNGYTSSGGWLAVHASIQMTQPATVTEIGLDFEGFVWALVSGLEGGWFSSDEIGLAYLWSSRVIRSQMPGEAETVLSNVPYHLEYLKVDYEYSVEHVPLSRHVLPLNLEAVNGQTFSVDYVLHWDIDRSPGSADAAATFGATVWSPQPYIVYKSCHSEYRQVGRFYREAARQMFKRRA
ncbi:MAG: hypothetical protein WD823_07985 [Sulfuricaulis sp.]|uniref:hypothetical protein n=1 Tax=Sulfuricaulis sp. TaxID=2003553 RepID=UPI0034A3A89D